MQLFKHFFSYFIIIDMAICKLFNHDAKKDYFNYKTATVHSFVRIFAGQKVLYTIHLNRKGAKFKSILT